jgi:hypothetical protein
MGANLRKFRIIFFLKKLRNVCSARVDVFTISEFFLDFFLFI